MLIIGSFFKEKINPNYDLCLGNINDIYENNEFNKFDLICDSYVWIYARYEGSKGGKEKLIKRLKR